MSHNAFSTTLRLVLASTAAAAAAGLATISSAAAYETGFSELRPLYTMQAADSHCKTSEEVARMTLVVQPEYPEIALGQGIEGSTLVVFAMSNKGTVSNATIADTSGDIWLDFAALDAVERSHYAPAVHNCAKIAGLYGIEVVFAK